MLVKDLIADIQLEDPEAFDEIVPNQWLRYINKALISIRPLLKQYDRAAFSVRDSVTVTNGEFPVPEDMPTGERFLLYSNFDYSPLSDSYYELRGGVVRVLSSNQGQMFIQYDKQIGRFTDDNDEFPITDYKAIESVINEVKRYAYNGTNEGEGSNASDEAIKDLNQII